MPKLQQGYIQIYTGPGKGKTTAALGLAVRAIGAGLRVCLIQFLKGRKCSEQKAMQKFKNLAVMPFGQDCFIRKKPQAEDFQEARRGIQAVAGALLSGKYDLVIADEICVAVKFGLLSQTEVLETMRLRKKHVELVLTGRGATPAILQQADLVTVMQEKKHYYQKKVKARKGIEF